MSTLLVKDLLTLTAFRILSLSLYFASFTMLCCVFVDFKGSSLSLWTLMPVSFPRLGKFSDIICSNKPSVPFSRSSGTHMIGTLLHFMESLSSVILPSWSSSFLSHFFFSFIIFCNFIFYFTYSWLCFFYVVTVSSLFCISVIAFLNSSWQVLRSLISEASISLVSSVLF